MHTKIIQIQRNKFIMRTRDDGQNILWEAFNTMKQRLRDNGFNKSHDLKKAYCACNQYNYLWF